MNLSMKQNEVVTRKRNNYLVSAGAGSGKTTVLTERVIHLLKDEKYKLNEMIILTFTDLAAKEMKDRIIQKLSKVNDPSLNEELKHINEAEIKTFDSFCHDFVTKYSCYSKIDSNFNIGDQAFFEMKMNEFINQILETKYKTNETELLLLIQAIGSYGTESFSKYFINLYKDLKTYLGYKDILSNYDSLYQTDNMLNNAKKELHAIICNKLKIISNTKYNFIDDYYNDLYFNILSKIKELSLIDNFDMLVNELNNYKLPNKNSRKASEGDKEKISKLHDYISNQIKGIKKMIPESSDSINEDFYKYNSLYSFIKDIIFELDEKMSEYKEYHRIYGFDDIEMETIRILKENPNVQKWYKDNIKEILIDEYQDTNDIGNTIINLIENKNVVVVGDIKQSIYRFRHANPNIFKGLLVKYSKHDNGELIDLMENYRSRKEEVIDFANDIFINIKNTPNVDMDYLEQKLEYGNKLYDQFTNVLNKPKIIKFYKNLKDEDKNKIETPSEYELIAYDIYLRLKNKQTVMDKNTGKERLANPGDFLVLNRTNSSTELIQKELKKYGIPSKAFTSKNFLKTFEITFIKNILIIINFIDKLDTENEEFEKAIISVLRSFVFNASGNEILKYKVRENNERNIDALKENFSDLYNDLMELLDTFHKKNAYYLVKEIISKYDLYRRIMHLNNYEEREIKLVKLISNIENLSKCLLSLDEIISYMGYLGKNNKDIDIKQNDLEQSDYVSIMTIHKSKGLEKPICYISGLSYKKGTITLNFSLKYGIYLKNSNSIMDRISKIEEEQELKREKIRLLYVALTRARESLTFTFDGSNIERIEDFDDANNPQELLLLNNDLKKYMIDLEIKEVEPIKKDEKKSYNSEIIFDEIPKVEKILIKKEKASHDLYTIDGEIQKYLNYGTLIHSYFEKINFLNDIKEEISKYKIKNEHQKYLYNFKCQHIFNNELIKEYHELEFYSDNTNGIIDYLLETKDKMIIVDFKLKNIDDPLYINQLETYKKYISIRTNKPIETYLYSILKNELKKISL